MRSKVDGMIHLARKAGKIIYGSDAAVKAVRFKKAYLVILAEDASENTKKLINNKCKSFGVQVLCMGTAAELGEKFGKSDISVMAVSDENFAKAILNNMAL